MLTKFFTALMAALMGLLPSSCTSTKGKSPVQQQHASTAASAVNASSTSASTNSVTNSKNLGELQLTNHYETCVQLGNGETCTIKPNLLDHGNLQITMALESKKTDGKTTSLSVVQFATRPGRPFEVAVGDMNFTLTPELANE